MIVEAPDVEAMESLGASLAAGIEAGLTIFVSGDLGAGKTTLTRGFLRALGHVGPVKSPTYTLVEPYEVSGLRVYHFDLYRVSDSEELEFMGIRDYFSAAAVCVVEWPERATNYLPRPDLELKIAYCDRGRCVSLAAATSSGARALARLRANSAL